MVPIIKIGGAKEDRTPDLLNAIQALSQLSYNPKDKGTIKNLLMIVKSFLLPGFINFYESP